MVRYTYILFGAMSHLCAAAITASSVRLKLANDDTEAQARGESPFLHKEVTPSLLMYQGIEIEDQQYVPF